MTTEEEITRALEPATRLIREAIPKALAAAKEDGRYSALRPLSGVKLSTDFRYEMKLILDAHRSLLTVEEIEEVFIPDKIGNLGLQFTFNSIHAKILKGSDGKLPKAMTDARVEYYTQPELNLGGYTNTDLLPRVIYLWECNDLESESRVWLIRPKATQLRSTQIDTYWGFEIPLITATEQKRDKTGTHRSDLPIGLPTGETQDDRNS